MLHDNHTPRPRLADHGPSRIGESPVRQDREEVVDLHRAVSIEVASTRRRARSGARPPCCKNSEKVIDAHHAHLESDGRMQARMRQVLEVRILKTAEDMVRRRFRSGRDGHLGGLLDDVVARRLDPHAAAESLLAALSED